MPQPVNRDVWFSRPLTNISIAYQQDASQFIADKVFPVIPVPQQGGLYWMYNRDDWFRSVAQERAPSTESAGGGWELDRGEYFCRVYAVHKDVDDQTRANADSMFNQDRDATLWVTQNLLLKRDQLFLDTYLKTGVWSTDMAGVGSSPSGNQFLRFDVSGSDPIEQIQTDQLRVLQLTGQRCNTLVMGPSVELTLMNHPAIIDRIKYTQRGTVTRDLLASLFGVDRILVTNAIVNSAKKGEDLDMGFMHDKDMLLCYSAPNPGLQIASAGYIFAWTGLLGGGAYTTVVSRWREEKIKSDRIEGEMAFSHKVVAPDLGIYYSAVVQ